MKRILFLISYLMYFPLFSWEYQGSFKNILKHEKDRAKGSSSAFHQSFRIETHHKPRESLFCKFAVNFFSHLEKKQSMTTSQREGYRLFNLGQENIKLGRDLTLMHNLDRAYLQYSRENHLVSLGRQAIQFGSARAINPTNIFSPHPFFSFLQEESIGVDAFCFNYYLNELTEMQALGAFSSSKKVENNPVSLRCKHNIQKMDLNWGVLRFEKNLMLLLDIETSLYNAGFYIENAYTYTPHLQQKRLFQCSLGIDYRFFSRYLFLEYHYNGAGACQNSSTKKNQDNTSDPKLWVFLQKKHYLTASLTEEINPLFKIQARVFCEIQSPAYLLQIKSQYNIGENKDLEASLSQGFGKKGTTLSQEPLEFQILLTHYF